jgi:misacylated tRNA(Ala) deacylase
MTEEIFRADAYARQCEATVLTADGRGIRLDRTVFYPTGGGQPGDTGTLATANGRSVAIVDTVKDKDTGTIWHVPAPGSASLQPGDSVTAVLDWERRYRHMRLHSCLHLLCSLIPFGVTGGAIAADKARLDFDIPEPKLDKETLTRELNRLVAEDRAIAARYIPEDELRANPALVRTLAVGPPLGSGTVRLIEVAGVDSQPCGGTHVKRSGEIGHVRVAKIENKGRHNRRVVVAFEE